MKGGVPCSNGRWWGCAVIVTLLVLPSCLARPSPDSESVLVQFKFSQNNTSILFVFLLAFLLVDKEECARSVFPRPSQQTTEVRSDAVDEKRIQRGNIHSLSLTHTQLTQAHQTDVPLLVTRESQFYKPHLPPLAQCQPGAVSARSWAIRLRIVSA
ncbi:hypothetical protein J6590_048408 [Homalodisca vitripennis]|nr:hypothetical protein J6590_048408 [Homalodisca vitripennis]